MKIVIVCLLVLFCLCGCGSQEPASVQYTQVTTEPAPISFQVSLPENAAAATMVFAQLSESYLTPTYRWYVDGTLLPYATSDMLTVPVDAAGKQIYVTATLDGFTAQSQMLTVTECEREAIPMAAIAHSSKLYGRCDASGTSLILDYSASGIEMNVNSLGGDMTISCYASYDLYVAVFVDGEQTQRPLLTTGTNELVIPLKKGDHTVMVLKETEVNTSGYSLQLVEMKLEGTVLEKPADRELYIEFIGDSIACGDGSLGKFVSGQKWSLEDHSGTHGFAYLTAQNLNADWSVFARGGIGLMKPAGKYTAGQMFNYVNLYRDQVTHYTPARIPDVVVVELGANDDKNDTAGFVAAYGALVDDIRAMYGEEVKIVWTGKNMNQYNAAQYVAEQRKDANMFAFQFSYGGSGAGALATQSVGHPDAAEQQAFADALTAYLEKNVLN